MLTKKELNYFSFEIFSEEGEQLTEFDYKSLDEAIADAKRNGLKHYQIIVLGSYTK